MVRALTFLAIATGLGLAAGMCRAQVEGKDLKAAYIFNFAMFTTWPDAAGKGPLFVCATPDNPLWPGLSALNGKPINGRPWTVTDLAHPKAARCDIAVLARAAQQPAPAAGVLVVRDGAGSKAAITLVEDDEHIRFDIDTQEAARSGLRFSSHLLRLARNVL